MAEQHAPAGAGQDAARPRVEEFRAHEWSRLSQFMSETFGEGFGNSQFVFRGEPDCYPHCFPMIDRVLPPSVCVGEVGGRLNAELAAMLRFRRIAPMHLDQSVRAVLDEGMQAQVVMRHFGAPTRLLDWTESPWVALYFACEDAAYSGEAAVPVGRVLAFDRASLEHVIRERFGDESQAHAQMVQNLDGYYVPRLITLDFCREAHDWVVAYHRHASTFPRLYAQQGLFTIGSKPWIDHWRQIQLLCPAQTMELRIDPRLKFTALRHLLRMGLSGASLFADAGGVAREVVARTRLFHGDDLPRD